MSAVRQVLLAISGYATFSNSGVQEATAKLLGTIDANLDELNYEPAEKVAEAAEELEEAMNEADVEEPEGEAEEVE